MLNKTQPCHLQPFLQTHQEDTNSSFRTLEYCYYYCDNTKYTQALLQLLQLFQHSITNQLRHLQWACLPLQIALPRTPRWAPETDPQWGPRHLDSHREKTTGTSWALTIWLCSSWNWTAVSSCQRRNGPPTEPGFSQGFFLRSVTDGVLVPCRCSLWLA